LLKRQYSTENYCLKKKIAKKKNKKKTLFPMGDSHFWLQTKKSFKKNTG
jgi:hypothetical protein